MLTGSAIRDAVRERRIVIDPFSEEHLNPNSYNVCLGSTLRVYRKTHVAHPAGSLPLEPFELEETEEVTIPSQGFVLRPAVLYLGTTVEWTESRNYVPMLSGRSSLARLGLQVHQTGGFGDIGFSGRWTLEFSCVHPVRVYVAMRIAQIAWFEPTGAVDRLYRGKYQNQEGVVASRLWEEGPPPKK